MSEKLGPDRLRRERRERCFLVRDRASRRQDYSEQTAQRDRRARCAASSTSSTTRARELLEDNCDKLDAHRRGAARARDARRRGDRRGDGRPAAAAAPARRHPDLRREAQRGASEKRKGSIFHAAAARGAVGRLIARSGRADVEGSGDPSADRADGLGACASAVRSARGEAWRHVAPAACARSGACSTSRPTRSATAARTCDPSAALAQARAHAARRAPTSSTSAASRRGPRGKTYGAGAAACPRPRSCAAWCRSSRRCARGWVRASRSTPPRPRSRAARAARGRHASSTTSRAGSHRAAARSRPRTAPSYVLMHNRGRGEAAPPTRATRRGAPRCAPSCWRRSSARVARGVARERIWIDPGIGFAKTAAQSVALLARTAVLVATGHARAGAAPSRKSLHRRARAAAPAASAPAPQRAPGRHAAAVTRRGAARRARGARARRRRDAPGGAAGSPQLRAQRGGA